MVFGINKKASGLDFSDGDKVPLTPNAAGFAGSTASYAGPLSPSNLPSHLRRNKSEKVRLQGLMGGTGGNRASTLSLSSVAAEGSTLSKADIKKGVSRETTVNWFKYWMVNEGGRKFFIWTWILVHLLVFTFGFFNYQFKDNLTQARATFSITYPIARSAALVLHVDVAFILLPICRNFITLLRRSALNHIIPFEKNITFHKFTGWSIVFFSTLHTAAHMVNFTELAIKTGTGIIGFIGANFLTGPGATGWIMFWALAVMAWYARETPRRARFERFWYSHHLFIIFFSGWQLHGMFCMIKPDRPPYCDFMQIGVFWKYWIVGGAVFLWERILREVRSRHKTFISKVIQHPSKVCEVQIKKEKTVTRAGQYIFLNCPEVSFWQWHPFTLTSAPEEDYISVHIRCVGDFTTEFAEALGCDFSRGKDKPANAGVGNAAVVQPPTSRVLPRVMVDGPFGSASEDVFKFEAVILVGGGIGVTPFASILKSIWYRVNYPQGKMTRLQKVYFFWVCRDFDTCEWFKSLLEAVEEQDTEHKVEVHIYITAKMKEDDINNIVVTDVGGEKDAITKLRSPTHYGRPNWDRIFYTVRDRHPATDVGVFFCGPGALGHTLHLQCNKWTGGEDGDTRFFWGKENF